MASNVPEEGVVDQRADPAWFGNSSASMPADPQMSTGGGAQQRGSSYQAGARQGSAYQGSAGIPGPEDSDARGGSQYQRPAPPYPAQLPPAQPSTGVAAKVTAQLSALKNRPRSAAPPRRPRPAPPARPRVAVSSRPMPRTSSARRAQLTLARIEPWSVMKFSFLVSLVGWVVLFVAVTALYYVLSKLGVFHSIQATIDNVTSTKGSAGADANSGFFSFSRIIGYTMLIGAINVVLITALATVGAVIYNLVTHLAGGIEVTLRESD